MRNLLLRLLKPTKELKLYILKIEHKDGFGFDTTVHAVSREEAIDTAMTVLGSQWKIVDIGLARKED